MESRFAQNAREYTARNLEKQTSKRCLKCWLDIRELCICSRLPSLYFGAVKFIIYQDYKEYLNPGDDAKLLMCTAPTQTNLILYPHEDDKLLEILSEGHQHNTCILFPSDSSMSLDEYVDRCAIVELNWKEELPARRSNTNPVSTSPFLTVILIDAVWRHARKMANHLVEILPWIPRIQLSPSQLSVYARTQSQPDRICTIEACALCLQLLGCDPDHCNQLIDCVRLNNSALKRKKQVASKRDDQSCDIPALSSLHKVERICTESHEKSYSLSTGDVDEKINMSIPDNRGPPHHDGHEARSDTMP